MSVPRIPGFTTELPQGRLIELWSAPDGDYPAELWPSKYLGMVNPNPTDWLLVSHEFRSPAEQGGTGCVLVEPAHELEAIADTSWIGRDLGESWVDLDDHIHGNGLEATERGVPAEFFVKGQTPLGSELPVVSLSQPFLWYWDAFPVGDEWRYLNHAGREQDLVRIERTAESWSVEVRALEFRTYLEACGRNAVMQMDYTLASDHGEFERVHDEYSCQWAHFRYCAVHHQISFRHAPG
jgi:hypothetical protein